MGELSKDDLLRSWKEIAAYLGVDVRTCYRWEDDRGMPVHRAEAGERKSPVFAYKNELDAWFGETFKNSHPMDQARGSRLKLRWALGGGAFLIAAGVLLYVLVLRHGPPADFHIEGSMLIVVDKHDHELWRKDTKAEDLRPESFYRGNFQVMHKEQSGILPSLVIKDINGDGDTEVVFALKREKDQTGEGDIFCWDRRGTKLWKFHPNRLLECGRKVFSPDYRISGFYCRDIDGDGKLEIFVKAFQAPDWPCLLAVLDSSGKMIGEFWNAGYLTDLSFWDINGDGREELIVCGVNNEYRGGCLMVFDPRHISGASPQSGEFFCKGLGPGSMLYYITTPYTEVSRAHGDRVDGLREVDVTGNAWIRSMAGNGLIYEFDFGLRCIQASWGNSFAMSYDELRRSGAVTSELGRAYSDELRDGIRYFDGTAWTAVPTPVKR